MRPEATRDLNSLYGTTELSADSTNQLNRLIETTAMNTYAIEYFQLFIGGIGFPFEVFFLFLGFQESFLRGIVSSAI